MDSTQTRHSASTVSRREVIRRLAVVGTGLSIGLAAGCTPIKIGLGVYPSSYDTNLEIGEQVLRAFVTTVIPGIPATTPNLIRVFMDEDYPLAPYRGYLIADLCKRADKLFDMKLFNWLDAEQRTQVIQNALSSHKVHRQLYEGAIFLTQISCYAGIYDAEGGCEFIDFPGANSLLKPSQQTYPDPERYFAHRLTADGNYA